MTGLFIFGWTIPSFKNIKKWLNIYNPSDLFPLQIFTNINENDLNSTFLPC